MGGRPGRQPRRTRLPHGAPSRRPRFPPLLLRRGVPPRRAPPARRGKPARGQPRRLAVPPHVQHLQNRRGGDGALGRRTLRAADDDRPPVRPVRRQRRLARHPPPHDVGRDGGSGPPRQAQRLSPAARRRHRRHGPAPPRRGLGTGHDGELGWERSGEHRGVVHVSRRPGRRRAAVRDDRPHDRQRGDGPHADARAGRADERPLARRDGAHGQGLHPDRIP